MKGKGQVRNVHLHKSWDCLKTLLIYTASPNNKLLEREMEISMFYFSIWDRLEMGNFNISRIGIKKNQYQIWILKLKIPFPKGSLLIAKSYS